MSVECKRSKEFADTLESCLCQSYIKQGTFVRGGAFGVGGIHSHFFRFKPEISSHKITIFFQKWQWDFPSSRIHSRFIYLLYRNFYNIWLVLSLPTFNTVVHNSRVLFQNQFYKQYCVVACNVKCMISVCHLCLLHV